MVNSGLVGWLHAAASSTGVGRQDDILTDKLRKIRNGAAAAWSAYNPDICLQDLRKTSIIARVLA
jgi:hypothetical protein